MSTSDLEGMIDYLYEMGLLKRLPRAGWLVAGIDHPESIAEHSFRAAIIGYLLASVEGADPARTALLCLFHDTQESRIGDVPGWARAMWSRRRIHKSPPIRSPGSRARSVRPSARWSTTTRARSPSRHASPVTRTSSSA
jgi:hypothetical protein